MTTPGFYLDPTYPQAQAPVRHHGGDLGLDLFAAVDTFVPFLVPVLIPTGVIFAFPEGVGAIVTDRSSSFLKRGLMIHHGKIDNQWREPVGIAAYSIVQHELGPAPVLNDSGDKGPRPYGQWVRAGERIAQVCFVNVHPWEPGELSTRPESLRGGWGSTGTGGVR